MAYPKKIDSSTYPLYNKYKTNILSYKAFVEKGKIRSIVLKKNI